MRYVRQTLTKGERVLYEARISSIVYVLPFFIFVIALWGALVFALAGSFEWALVALAIGIAASLSAFVRQWTTEIAITNSRVICKIGWIAREVHEVNLNRIEGVRVKQDVLGRMLDFGEVVVRGTGVGDVRICEVDGPTEFRRAIGIAVSQFLDAQEDARVARAVKNISASAYTRA